MINKISICGVGRLGLPLALNFERKTRVSVIGYDANADYVNKLKSREFKSDEPGVTELLAQSSIEFHSDISVVLTTTLAIVCVRTDSETSGAYDMSQLWTFVECLTNKLKEKNNHSLRSLAINCNVNPGTSRLIANMLEPFNIEVYFWPEWVKQGSIIQDQINPPVTVLGTQAGYKTFDDVCDLLRTIDTNQTDPKFRILGLIEAELCKISLNCFLTVKISFANMVANLLEELGLESAPVLEALSNDPRIGPAFLQPGFGYGGPCLPRDNRALSHFAQKFGVDMPLCAAADSVNEQRHRHLSKHAARRYHVSGVTPELDSLSYKAGIPIFTESQQLRLALQMSEIGIASKVKDKTTIDYLNELKNGQQLLLK